MQEKEDKNCKDQDFGVESSDEHVKTEDSEFEETKMRRTNSNGKNLSTSMAHIVEEPKTRDRKSAKPFTSKFPFFVKRLRRYNVNTVFILKMPKSSQNFPQGKSEMLLRNSEGESWTVNVVLAADKAHAFSGGWKAFARDNLLKEGDCCVFELVKKNEMQVHIS